MSSAIFGSSAGNVVKVALPGNAAPGRISFGDAVRLPDPVVITGIGLDMKENVQFVQALSDAVYIYSFGSRVSSIQVDGLVMLGLCNNARDNLQGFIDYYKQHRASKYSNALDIAMASVAISGYLVGGSTRLVNDSYGVATFSFQLASTTLVQA